MSRTVRMSDGVRLAVQERGDRGAPTVVAVHGYPDDHRVWHGVADDLAADHRVVTYDVRGAGASDAPRHPRGLPPRPAGRGPRGRARRGERPTGPSTCSAHDWGAIQAWHAVTDPGFAARVASFTSISGPCLDHIADWFRRGPRAARPSGRRRSPGTRRCSGCRCCPSWAGAAGCSAGWRRGRSGCRRRSCGTRSTGWSSTGPTSRRRWPRPRSGARRCRCRCSRRAATATSPSALQRSAAPFVDDFTMREIDGGHWVVRHRPELVADPVRAFVRAPPR